MKKIAFLGVGNMGSAIIRSAIRGTKHPSSAGDHAGPPLQPGEIVVTDADFKKAESLADELGCVAVQNNAEAAAMAEYVVLCVKPQILPGVLAEIAPVLRSTTPFEKEDKVLISIAAGVSIADLRRIAGDLPIIRVMPNTPALIGRGLLLLARGENVSDTRFDEVRDILSGCGETAIINETMMDGATVLSSCSPAYAYMFVEALTDAGVSMGFPAEKARFLAAKALEGAAAMVLESGKHPAELRDMVCSPGGSTIAGVLKLEDGGFASAVQNAALASYKRTKELG